MRFITRSGLWCLVAVSGISALAISADPRSASPRSIPRDVEGAPVIVEPKEQLGRTTGNGVGSRDERTGDFSLSGEEGVCLAALDPEQFVERALQFDDDKDGKLDREELLKLGRALDFDGKLPDDPTDGSVGFRLKSLPSMIKDDGLACKNCEKIRLVKCEHEKCRGGFVQRRISGKRFMKRFPCQICLGLTTTPCGSCRKREYDHTLSQSAVIGRFLKKGRAIWIEFLPLQREVLVARATLNNKSSSSKEKKAANAAIQRVGPKLAVVRKKNLEVQQAIAAVFRQQIELCLRSTSKTQRSALRERGVKAIENFVILYNLGYYY